MELKVPTPEQARWGLRAMKAEHRNADPSAPAD